MADDIKPDDIPFVMPQTVTIADRDGKPTTAMLDWFQSLWSWMKRSVVDLTTKITTVISQVDDIAAEVTVLQEAQADLEGAFASYQVTVTAQFGTVNAAISSEASTRASVDSALASSITTVDAKANAATASGQVYFTAMAGPPGSVAAYGIYLTAGNVFTGLQLVARSDGSSYIAMTAGQLYFYDNSSGSTINALTYSGGEWLLSGTVTIRATDGSGRVAQIKNGCFQSWDEFGTLRFRAGIW